MRRGCSSLPSDYPSQLTMEPRRAWEDMMSIFQIHGKMVCARANMPSQFYTYVLESTAGGTALIYVESGIDGHKDIYPYILPPHV
jgi:hypothetical protein